MLLAQVVGTVNATVKQPALDGHTVLCVEPRDEVWRPTGEPSFLALDFALAGVGDRVLVVREGGASRLTMGVEDAPVHAVIVGIVDAVECE
ncbi:MAG: EutN/CcmL family microcompartment protein [bacterium]|jgi:microcompartment protein CcmK/EutM|nr:EutN/CcmL family microcompartment protein [bacterium]